MAAAVSPDAILQQLAALWVTLAQPGDEGRAAVLRACTMTLITVAADDDNFSTLGETLAALMPEHPARSIVVRLRDSAVSLSARVYSQCWMPFGQRRHICCEQVEIEASYAELEDVASLLVPLCVPDLPVVVWGASARAVALPAFPKLAAVASKVVVDTQLFSDPKTALQFLDACGPRLLPADLAWTRLTRWREVLARLFDNREYQARLSGISRVRVACSAAAPSTAALYMAAWLTGCLRDAGVEAAVSFQTATGPPACALASVALSGDAPAALDIEISPRGDSLSTRVDGIFQCAILSQPTPYLLLREEIGILRHDPVYRRALSSAIRLAVSSGVK